MLLNRPPEFFAIPAGALRLTRIDAADTTPDVARWLFVGDATAGPITRLIPDDGDGLPAKRDDLTDPLRLKIVHFNDLHGHLVYFCRDRFHPVFARMAGYIDAQRRRCRDHPQRGVLVLGSGDDAVGTPFDALLGHDEASFRTHAAYRLYSAAGIDACTLGNHDLDFGGRRLAHALRCDARFPLLTANLAGCSWLTGLCFPAALFVVKGVRVAVIGLTTPAQIAAQPDSTLHFAHPVQVMENLLPAINAVSDVVIVLSHLGYSLAATSAGVLAAGDRELAAALPTGAVQVIIGGHTHHALNEQGLSPHNLVNGIPIVQAGKAGEFLGEVEITVGRRWATVTHVQLLATARLPDDDDFTRQHIQPLLDQLQPILAAPLGIAADDPDLSLDAVRNELAAHESALGNFVTDALAARCRELGDAVDFAMIDASCIASGLPAGELTFGDWFAVTPFADTIQLCRMTGAQVRRLLDGNAQRIDRPGEAHTERGFLHFSREVRYRIVLGDCRATARAVDVTVNGRPLVELQEQQFTVACTSFIHMLAAAWERTADAPLLNIHTLPKANTYRFVRDELIAYIRAHDGVTAESGARRDGRLEIERLEIERLEIGD